MAQNEEIIIDIANSGAGLPDVDSGDNGKVLAVVNGEWDKSTIPSGNLPPVSSADNGKVLRVVSGVWDEDGLDDITGNAKILPQIPRNKGFITSGNKWNYTEESNYLFILIPISGGETLSMVGSSSRAVYYAALRTFTTPADNTYPDFSTETGWTGRKQVNTGASATVTLPSDGRYLYICVLDNNRASDPQKVVVGNYNYTASSVGDAILAYINAQDNVVVADSKVRELDLFSVDGINAPIQWEVGTLNASQGVGHPVTDYNPANHRQRGAGIYQFSEPMDVTCDASYYYQVYLLDSDYNLVSSAFNTFSSEPYTIPAKTPFRIVVGKRDDSDISSVDITQYISVKFDKIKDVLYHDNGVRWCAMGDSITEGYYSYFDGDNNPQYELTTKYNWAKRVSEINKWNLTNLGDGGTGWLDEDEYGGCAYKRARNTDFSGFNLVTLAFGVNDWKGNQPLGERVDVSEITTPTTVIQAMQITIETIIASNPNCKIIGILPINCSKYGNETNNWGLGFSSQRNPTITNTLEEVVQAMIGIYNYYGIQYIDMAHYSVVNRKNIQAALPDGVHPSLATHELMAHELSKKITF